MNHDKANMPKPIKPEVNFILRAATMADTIVTTGTNESSSKRPITSSGAQNITSSLPQCQGFVRKDIKSIVGTFMTEDARE